MQTLAITNNYKSRLKLEFSIQTQSTHLASSIVLSRNKRNLTMEAKTKTGSVVYRDFEPYGEWEREEAQETLVLHLPDFKKDQLRVQVSNHGVLKISGERPLNKDGTERKRFYREARVPTGSDINGIHAKLMNGRLQIIMPKKIAPASAEPQPQVQQPPTPQQPQQLPQEVDKATSQKPDAEETSDAQEKMRAGEPKEQAFVPGMISSFDTARLRVGKKMAVDVGVAVLVMVAIGAYAVYKYKSSSAAIAEE